MTALPAGAIRLRGVSKRYTKYEDTPTLAYGLLHAFGRSHRSALWAVRDMALSVEPGESIGVIGRNGSGKSTLLAMLCGVTGPTTGRLHVAGRIAPLISVGVGFHPELTGRENVFVNGTILGLERVDIQRRLDSIIEFSEIESFIDTPVKFYSSGMYVRLGFSVAAHVHPNVLLVDEVLSVGDQAFQWKCFKHMETLRADGTTIILVSHNLQAVERYCDRGLVLSRGRAVFDGDVGQAIDAYNGETDTSEEPKRLGETAVERDVIELCSVQVLGEDGAARTRFSAGETAVLQLRIRARQAVNAPYLRLDVIAETGEAVHREHNLFEPYPALAAGESAVLEGRVKLLLTTGLYNILYCLGRGSRLSREPMLLADDVADLMPPRRASIYVQGRPSAHGLADLPTSFAALAD